MAGNAETKEDLFEAWLLGGVAAAVYPRSAGFDGSDHALQRAKEIAE